MNKVLVVDDNQSICEAIGLLLSLDDIDCEVALTPQAGLNILEKDASIGLVIQDMNFTEDTTSGGEGVELFNQIRNLWPDMPVILMTTWTQIEMAVSLIRAGAADYIAKPWDNEKLMLSVKNMLELQELQRQRLEDAYTLQRRKTQLAEEANLCGFVYESQELQTQLEMAVRVARSNIPILITGPIGSGKEKIAEIIQANSSVASGPFVKVNMGALSSDTMDVELFGQEPEGSIKGRAGLFESADGGTLFLDEIGNLSTEGQLKLLRVLETGEFQRSGSNTTRRCNVRIISSTNSNINDVIKAGEFREDLYYRLNGIEIKLPPLSERRDDILPLLHCFLGKKFHVSPDTAKRLQVYSWPGNVRELESAAKRATLLGCKGTLDFDLFGLPEALHEKSPPRIVVEPSKEMIETALNACGGVVAQAARQLGLTRQALYRRMERHGLHHPQGSNN